MPQRSLTDATGSRWDVSEEPGGEGRHFRLSFRDQSGRRLDVPSRQGVNALSDRELLRMLARETGENELSDELDRGRRSGSFIAG